MHKLEHIFQKFYHERDFWKMGFFTRKIARKVKELHSTSNAHISSYAIDDWWNIDISSIRWMDRWILISLYHYFPYFFFIQPTPLLLLCANFPKVHISRERKKLRAQRKLREREELFFPGHFHFPFALFLQKCSFFSYF